VPAAGFVGSAVLGIAGGAALLVLTPFATESSDGSVPAMITWTIVLVLFVAVPQSFGCGVCGWCSAGGAAARTSPGRRGVRGVRPGDLRGAGRLRRDGGHPVRRHVCCPAR
jgi:hypothetical protein